MDRSPNAQARALLQLHDTPIMADPPSPAEILHGWPAQGTVLSRPSKRVNICQIWQRLVELQEKQKEQFNKAHRAKDLHPLKVKEQVQFFQNKQATGPIKWTTGTVVEILKCGQSYMIQGPNGRVYRRNQAHLKPICHDGTSFQDHHVNKEEKQPKDNSFQDHQASLARSMSFNNRVSYIDNEASYMDTWTPGPWCLMAQRHIKHPWCHQLCHPLGATHLGHHHIHHQHHFHPESHQSSPAQRTHHLKAGRDISLNQLSSDLEMLTKDSHMDFQLS